MEAARQEEVESARFRELFEQAPKEAIGLLVEVMLRELKDELKRELVAEFELNGPHYDD